MSQLGILLDYSANAPRSTDDSDSDSYCTPSVLTEMLPLVDLDPASNERSTIRARRSICLPDDGLARPWSGTVWCNPPYSNVGAWVDHAIDCARDGGEVLMLIKADSTTKWWAAAIESGATPIAFRRRITFGLPGKTLTANFASAFLWFKRDDVFPEFYTAVERMRIAGWVW